MENSQVSIKAYRILADKNNPKFLESRFLRSFDSKRLAALLMVAYEPKAAG